MHTVPAQQRPELPTISELQSLLAEMQTEAGEELESMRVLARAVYPPLLESTGLRAAISARARQAPLPVTVRYGALPAGSGGRRLLLLH